MPLRYMIIAIVIGVTSMLIMKSNDKELRKNLDKEHIVVHLPKIYRWIGIIISLFFMSLLIIIVVGKNKTLNLSDVAIFIGGTVMGISIIIPTIVWKIHIFKNDNYIIYITFFGRKHTILYSDMTYYKIGEDTIYLKVKNKTFFIDSFATNVEIFLNMLRKNKVKQHLKRKK